MLLECYKFIFLTTLLALACFAGFLPAGLEKVPRDPPLLMGLIQRLYKSLI